MKQLVARLGFDNVFARDGRLRVLEVLNVIARGLSISISTSQ